MLRRAFRRSETESGKHQIRDETTSSNHPNESLKPLGSKKSGAVDQLEKQIENAVFGGEENLIENFSKFSSKSKRAKKRKIVENRKPVWEDEDDKVGSVEVSKSKRSSKKGEEEVLPTEKYAQKLKSEHQKVHSTPNWARLRTEEDDLSDKDSDSDVGELLQSTGDYITSSKSLSKGIIQIKQCTDANRDNPSKSQLTSVEFHPTSQVMLVAGMNQTLSLFQVDGKNNPKIQSIFVDKFPIYTAHFSANGEEVIMGSKHKQFNYYDMMAGKMVPVSVIKGLEETNMKRFVVSPDGRFLAFLGSYGNIHLLSAKTKEWIQTLKMNGSVESLCFTKDGNTMYSHGDDNEIYVWDMQTRDCIHHFIDDGCVKGTAVAISHDNKFLACGSDSGVVNIYEPSNCLKSKSPQPLKALMNLTTPCANLLFNSTGEILAMSSNKSERAVKLVHVPSRSVFSNFPDRFDRRLRIPMCMDFSRNSGYFTVGTHNGLALLYRVKHYSNY